MLLKFKAIYTLIDEYNSHIFNRIQIIIWKEKNGYDSLETQKNNVPNVSKIREYVERMVYI